MASIQPTYPSASAGGGGAPTQHALIPWSSASGETWTADNTQARWQSGAGGESWRQISSPLGTKLTNILFSGSFNLNGQDTVMGMGNGDVVFTGGGEIWARFYRYPDNHVEAQIYGGPGADSGAGGLWNTTGVVATDDWAVGYNGSAIVWYFNGSLVASRSGSFNGRNAAMVGFYNGGGGTDGGLTSISLADITGSAPSTPVPSASIKVSDGSGTSISFG